MKTIAILTAVALLATLAATPCAGHTFTWTGADWEDNTNWGNSGNWDGGDAGAWPGKNDTHDIVIIPCCLEVDMYPVRFNKGSDAGGVTIKRMWIEGRRNGVTDLEFLSDDDPHVLKIDPTQDGGLGENEYALHLASMYALMKLQDKSELWFMADSVIQLDGWLDNPATIEFAGNEEAPDADMPQLVIADGKTVTVAGASPLLKGTWQGRITGEVADPDAAAETFILNRSARDVVDVGMAGSFVIDTIFYNYADVHTSPDPDDENPPQGKITLTCHPKGGNGAWIVDGGSAGNESELIIDAAFAGSGNVEVKKFGILRINRHVAVLHDKWSRHGGGGEGFGDLRLQRGGKIIVKAGILLEIDKFQKDDCPEALE